jgi:hypothetical protein
MVFKKINGGQTQGFALTGIIKSQPAFIERLGKEEMLMVGGLG